MVFISAEIRSKIPSWKLEDREFLKFSGALTVKLNSEHLPGLLYVSEGVEAGGTTLTGQPGQGSGGADSKRRILLLRQYLL